MINELRFRYCFDIKKGKAPKKLFEDYIPNSYPYLTMEYIRTNTIDTYAIEGMKIPQNSCCLLWDGANAGEAFVNNQEGFLASTCAVLLSKSIIKRNMSVWYLLYLEDILRKLTNGMGIPHVNGEILKNQVLPIYDFDIQTQISDFLEKKAFAIDSLVLKEEKSIKEIEEYKKTLIVNLVTKGLRNKELIKNKCSLDINEIPINWTKNKLVRLAFCKSGSTPDRSNSKYWDNPKVNWMASGEVNKVNVYETDEKISEVAYKKSSLRMHPVNTVMIALNGQGKTKGMVAVLKTPSTCNQSLLGMTCYDKMNYKFLFYYFKAIYKSLRSQVGDKSREGLSGDYIKSLIIPVPPLDEQKEIVDYLDKKCEAIDKLLKLKEEKIEKLKEYKKSLIYECVTGRRQINA